MKGKKNSIYKLPMGKLFVQFPKALQAVMLCSVFGHEKYKEHDKDWLNYKRVEGQDYSDALIRHFSIKCPEQEESGLPPKFHVAWNALADLEKFIEKYDIDMEQIIKNKMQLWK